MIRSGVGIDDHLEMRACGARVAAFILPAVMVSLTILARMVPNASLIAIIAIYVIAFIAMLVFTIYDYIANCESDMSYALICPLSLSIFMNLFLSAIAPGLSSGIASVLLSSNILYSLVVSLVAVLCEYCRGELRGMAKGAWVALCILTGYAFVLFVMNPVTITSFLSTFRNLITPFSFLLLGATLSKRVSLTAVCDLIVTFGLIVVAFGLFELFVFQSFWVDFNLEDLWRLKGMVDFNLEDLWRLKGIPVSDIHLPVNFYSSERFAGVHVRRMTSLFADPVNLGTFLFSMFLVAWYRRRWIAAAIACVGCALAISKGALLGFLIWVFIYCLIKSDRIWVKRAALLFVVAAAAGFLGCALAISKGALLGFLIWVFIYCLIKSDRIWVKRAALLFVVAAAAGFLIFSFANSTGSVAAHMRGAIGGVISIVRNPFGYGCGNVGVLAALANETAMRGAEESGFGVIAGEVGVVGVMLYSTMFAVGVRGFLAISDKNLRIMALTLLLSIFSNIMFNEVALSPNSCGIYFSLMGLVLGGTESSNRVGAHFPRQGRWSR